MSENDFDKNIVRTTKLNLILGMIGAVFAAVMWYFTVWKKGVGAWWAHAFWGLFMLLDIILVLRYLLWRITYDETAFTVRNMFGVSRTYRYSQITAMEQGVQETKIWLGRKKVELESFSLEGMQFFFFAQQQYEKLSGNHDGIPEDWPKNDIFRGNIEGGMPAFIMEVIILFLGLGMLVILLISRMNSKAIIIIAVPELALLIFVVGSVIVGRHPERFSRKIVKLFFREEFVKIYRKDASWQNAYAPLSWEEYKDEMYNKDLASFGGEIVLMDYNDDDSRRFAIIKTENGYIYAFQRLFRTETGEMENLNGRQRAWRNIPDYEAKQTFDGEEEAFAALKKEREYLEYYN